MSDELFPESGLGVAGERPPLPPATPDEGLSFDDVPGLSFDAGDGGLFPEDAPDDPVGEIDYPGTADGDMKATLDAVGSAFAKRAKAEAQRFKNATDSEYWFAVVFETREQKEAFLRFMKWQKEGDKYLDGIRLAEKVKCPLPAAEVPYVAAKPDKKLNELSLPLE